MNGPKERGGLPTALKIAKLPTPYRIWVFPQVFGRRRTATRQCVSCGSRVTNRNLGGNHGRSALSSDLWCLQCADYPRQLVLNFGRSA
jgi:hypothetical protein